MPRIESLHARRILNSRGDWTVEVAVAVEGGGTYAASVPQGVSAGSSEVKIMDADKAVENIQGPIMQAIKGKDVAGQEEIDRILIDLDGTPDKSKLGGNAILGVSIACVRAAAGEAGVPLWKHMRRVFFGEETCSCMPRPFMNFIEGGLHAPGGKLEFQEHLMIPTAGSITDAVLMGRNLYRKTREILLSYNLLRGVGDEGGFVTDLKNSDAALTVLDEAARALDIREAIDFGLDAAAADIDQKPSDLKSMYRAMRERHGLWYLEDPFGEEAYDEFASLLGEIGNGMVIAGDDLTTTNMARVMKAREMKSINGIIVKPNQIGTVTEAFEVVKKAREFEWAVVCSHRGGDTNDDFIVDFSVAADADGLKIGGMCRGERIAKYNRLLEVEREVGQ